MMMMLQEPFRKNIVNMNKQADELYMQKEPLCPTKSNHPWLKWQEAPAQEEDLVREFFLQQGKAPPVVLMTHYSLLPKNEII